MIGDRASVVFASPDEISRFIEPHCYVLVMSALGQKQTCALHSPMSALPPKATSNATDGNVRFASLFDVANEAKAAFSSAISRKRLQRDFGDS